MGWSWSCFSKSRRLPSHRQPPVPTPPWPHTSIPVLGQSLNYSSLFLHTCARFIFIPVNLHFLILFMWNSLIFWCWKGRLFPRSNQPHSSSWFLSFMPLLFLSVSLIYWGSLFFRALSDYFPSGFCSNEILNLWDWFFFFQSELRCEKTLLWGIGCSRRFWLVLLPMAFTSCILLTLIFAFIIAHIILNSHSWILQFPCFSVHLLMICIRCSLNLSSYLRVVMFTPPYMFSRIAFSLLG